jgi:ATP-binding cassette subfamily C protein
MRLLLVFARAYPRRTVTVLVCLLFGGLAEGLGLSSLLPLIGLAAKSAGRDPAGALPSDGGFERAVTNAVAAVGIEPTTGALLGIIVGGVLVKTLLVLIANKQVGYAVAHMSTDLRLALIRAVLRTRWEYYIHQPVGAFANAVASEARQASQAYLRATTILSMMMQAMVYTAIALLVSWRATLASVVVGTVIVGVLARLVRMSRRAGHRQTKVSKSLLGRLTDTLQAVKPLKAMGREGLVSPLLEGETMRLNRALEREVLSKTALQALQEPLIVTFLAGGLYVALTRFALPLQAVITLALLCGRIIDRLGRVQKEFQQMVTSESAFWSIRAMIDRAEAAREVASGTATPRLERGITLREVSFKYDDRYILEGASLTVPAGELTLIVGPSGSGKTTIADLIIGLVRPQVGEVLVDDVPLQTLDIQRWRTMIGYVPQEGFLLHDTVRINVTLGDPALTAAEVEEALRAAGAWEFVCALPEGMDTVVGERGLRISGGQRQRVALARALVRRPRLLILDEATTALDPATEASICGTLAQQKGRVTILAISHQGAMAEFADRVYRASNGSVTVLPHPDGAERRAVARNA